MPKIEIEESELAALRSVNQFADQALNNPKTRAQMLRIQKQLNPDVVIPELDAEEAVMSTVSKVSEKVDSLMKKLEERETAEQQARNDAALQAKITAGQNMLRSKGYNDEGIKKIEELMMEEGIGSYAAGLTYFEKLNPPSEPADGSRGSPFGSVSDNDMSMSNEDMKELWESQGHSDAWLRKSLDQVRRDFRN